MISRLLEVRRALVLASGVLIMPAMVRAQGAPTIPGQRWPVHSMDRPRPPVVSPAPQNTLMQAPSDAIVLFDGRNLNEWRSADSSVARWRIVDGVIEVVPGSGGMTSRRSFGDVQLHIEWLAPPPQGEGQERGNSGVFLMGRYEVQVLDSYDNVTYADGQAASLYGQVPPLVNVTRPPGQWNAYDIVFHRPRFAADGSVQQPARVTVFHNGVLVQDNSTMFGATVHAAVPAYVAHPDRLPLSLQDHGNRMRFRNIWVRELE